LRISFRGLSTLAPLRDSIDDRSRHFPSIDVAHLPLVLGDRYQIACDAADVVCILERSSAAESPT
jgi:hypothetical protein